MGAISKRSVTAFLKSKGIDPQEFYSKGKPALRFKRKDVRKLEKRLLAKGIVIIRLTKKRDGYEFVSKRFVKLLPRYNFERPEIGAKARKIARGSHVAVLREQEVHT